jgi:hypothetical protein
MILTGAETALAHGNGHGGGHGGHHHGGAHFHSSVVIAGSWWYPPPYPYYYPYYPYYAPVYEGAPEVHYIEKDAVQEDGEFWYYCPGSRAYYPSVTECPEGWQEVAPTPEQ